MPSIWGPPMHTRLLYQQLKTWFTKSKTNQINQQKTTQKRLKPKMPSQRMHKGVWGWGLFPPCLRTEFQMTRVGTTSDSGLRYVAGKWAGESTSHSRVCAPACLFLLAGVLSCQTFPNGRPCSAIHVLSFTSLFVHLANIYWIPPKGQALGIYTWMEHTRPLPSLDAFSKSLWQVVCLSCNPG